MYPKEVTDTLGIHVRYIKIQDTCILGASLMVLLLYQNYHRRTCGACDFTGCVIIRRGRCEFIGFCEITHPPAKSQDPSNPNVG
jgi:hypothetical protein